MSQESIALDAITPCPGTHHPGKKVVMSYNLDKMLGAFVFLALVCMGTRSFGQTVQHCSVHLSQLSELLILRLRNGMIHSGERQM